MPNLSVAEYKYALNYLREIPAIKKDPNIIDVGIGSGFRYYLRQDPDRELCVCFHVKKKKNSNAKNHYQIKHGETISVPLNEKGTIKISLPCDVIEVNEVKPSGRLVFEDGEEQVTTGSVIKWNEDLTGGLAECWGIVTVAHSLQNLINNQSVEIKVSSQPGSGDYIFKGRMIVQSDNDQVSSPLCADTSIIDVSYEDLRVNGLHEPRWNSPSIEEIVPLSELVNCKGKLGESFPDGNNFTFTLGNYLGDSGIISELGVLSDLFYASSHLDRGFDEGRSGSVWRIYNRPALMQIGADLDTYNEGVGQSLETIIKWCESAIISVRSKYVIGSLKYVRSF